MINSGRDLESEQRDLVDGNLYPAEGRKMVSKQNFSNNFHGHSQSMTKTDGPGSNQDGMSRNDDSNPNM